MTTQSQTVQSLYTVIFNMFYNTLRPEKQDIGMNMGQ